MNDIVQAGNPSESATPSQAANGVLPSQPTGQPPKSGLIASSLQRLATPLLVALLIGLAWWGHQTGWTFPKFADLFGGSQTAKDDWCSEHAVPESECVECNRKLAPWITHYGFCAKHGVHNCPLEHPDAAQIENPPKVTKEDLDHIAQVLAFKKWPENTEECKKVHRLVQVASENAFNKMKVEVREARRTLLWKL